MLNILKYMSSFPPIWLTAAASLGYIHPQMPQFITAAAMINSLYSFLVRDLSLFDIYFDKKIIFCLFKYFLIVGCYNGLGTFNVYS
jgi:hypothetical protein